MLQFTAFAVLFPAGALVAGLRAYIGEMWRPLHIGIQLLATACVFLAVTIVHMGKNPPKIANKEHLRKHKILGPLIVLLILAQLAWAFYGRQLVEWTLWYYIHMALSASIISLGLANLYTGAKTVGYF
jgi:hypothetical protein